MGFVGVSRALYDYAPQAAGELAIEDGDLLYVLEKNDEDGWWKAKKKAGDEDEDEPVGLVPHNYVEEAPVLGRAKALFEYTRQTDEELSFHEDATLNIYDTSDPDWILVGLEGDYGFVPANYIDMSPADEPAAAAESPTPPALPVRSPSVAHEETQSPVQSPVQASPPRAPSGPAAALAGVMAGRSAPPQPASPASPASNITSPRLPQRSNSQYDDYQHVSDDDSVKSPALPTRPRPTNEAPRKIPVPVQDDDDDVTTPHDPSRTPGGFHMYNVNEMVSVMGKKKKMPTTLGINLRTGVILIAPEYASDGPSQEWTAEKMTHYSREGKHVFLELVRPSKSIDFHAGAKDTAEEIIMALGEMAGAVRAEGLKEVIMAGTKQGLKKGHILYDFTAQGEDEVSVAAGDEVIVVDNSKSEEWWQVRRLKNGREGVVPSSYIEVTGTVAPTAADAELDSIKAQIEQNRLDELRLTKEALKASKAPQQVGHGMPLPARGSSLSASENGSSNLGQQRNRRENGRGDGSGQSRSKPKPDPSKVRSWTDRSKSFSVDAQFLGLKDGKIHLHKMNGVKIAVPIIKMSKEDVEYVESLTGIPLAEDGSQSKRKSKSPDKAPSNAGVTVDKNKKPEYDWFQFFLDCDIAVGLCERYAQAFIKDSMDESVLPDVEASILRTLGLREGDIIKVMRVLDAKFGRQRAKDGDGGLFSGPGGTLRNNTRKGRPAPAVQTSDVVDASAFSKGEKSSTGGDESKSPAATSPIKANTTSSSDPKPAVDSGFDDDAWNVKPSKQPPVEPKTQSPAPTPAPATAPAAPEPPPPALSASMKELSLLSEPLQPSKAEVPQPTAPVLGQPTGAANATHPLPGATPGFFTSISQQPTGVPRQRPAPPQPTTPQGSIMPPPPQRPVSAPQTAQPSGFAAPGLAPQMTGALQGQVAPSGQSLNEITQARLLQQQQQQQFAAQMQQPALTGFQGAQPQGAFGMGAPAQFMPPMMTGAPGQSPFADPGRPASFVPMQAQPTGFQSQFGNNMQNSFGQPGQGSINNFLPPALEPQRTGMPGIQAQPTGMSTFGQPPAQQQPLQPLQPQQTGPAPPVRFGVSAEANKLAPQQTGRRANLSQATPNNPFGF